LLKFGAAFRITPMLSVGADFRYMNSSLTAKNSYSSVGADLLVAADFGPAKAVAGVTSLGAAVKSAAGTSYSIPTAATLAGVYTLSFAEKHALDARAQLDVFFKGGVRAGLGLEYGFNDMVFARAGYSYGGKSVFPSYLSFGLGAKFSGISINAAYLLGSSTLAGTLALGLGYAF